MGSLPGTSNKLVLPGEKNEIEGHNKVAVTFFTPTEFITKFPTANSWAAALATLSAAGWELVTVQHGLVIRGSMSSGGNLEGRLAPDPPSSDGKWEYSSCEAIAYFKRPIQAGRKIDDAL